MSHRIPKYLPIFGLLAAAILPGVNVWAACQAGTPVAELHESTPSSEFSVHPDHEDIVLHHRTGLMWKRCCEAQTWDGTGKTCTPTTGLGGFTWAAALEKAENATDGPVDTVWRLPNVKELASLVEACGYGPAINTEIFPGAPGTEFWTSTTYVDTAASQNDAWTISFSGQNEPVGSAAKTGTQCVRLVSDGIQFDDYDAQAAYGFAFLPVTDATPSAEYTSNSAVVTGEGTDAVISITAGVGIYAAGTYCGASSGKDIGWTAASSTVSDGDTVCVSQESSASADTTTTLGLTVGAALVEFDVTTAAKSDQYIDFPEISDKDTDVDSFSVTVIARDSATAADNGLLVALTSLTTDICTVSGSTVTLDPGDTLGTCVLRATQTGSAGYYPALPVDQSFDVIPPPEVDMALDISATPNPARSGKTVVFTVSVTNNGPSDAPAVYVNVTPPNTFVPGSSTFVSSSGCDEGAAAETKCTLGVIADGDAASFDLTYTVSNSATVTALPLTAQAFNTGVPVVNTDDDLKTLVVYVFDSDADGIPIGQDPFPTVAETNSCAGLPAQMPAVTVANGEIYSCVKSQIDFVSGAAVIAQGGSKVGFRASKTTLRPGFHAKKNSRVWVTTP